MMEKPFTGRAIGVLCHPSGIIDQFVRDDFNLNETFRGKHFKELLDHGSRAKSQAFFDEVRRRGATIDWELVVNMQNIAHTMNFAGGAAGSEYLICGVLPKDAMPLCLRELMDSARSKGSKVHQAVRRLLEVESQPISQSDTLECMTTLNNELLNAQRALQKTNIQLQRVNDEKNRALGIVAHDLRNPISIISMYSAYLLQSLSERATQEEHDYLQTIQRTAASMSNLVNDVLDVAAIESGQLDLDIADIDVCDLLVDIVERHRALARQQNVTLALNPSKHPSRLSGDAGKLEQVFNNLIDNAVKFSPEGGVVEITARTTATHVSVSVSDSGPGINQAALDKLFQPFSPGRATTKRGNSGTGLGLSIARKIVEGHGGKIEVISNSSDGAVFRVSLPRAT